LEYPVVFVVDVESGRFPMNASGYGGLLPQPLLANALQLGAYQTTRESEARLFYTALTRAERYLYVTGCALLPNGLRRRRQSAFALRLTHDEITRDPAATPDGLRPAQPRPRVDEESYPTSFS